MDKNEKIINRKEKSSMSDENKVQIDWVQCCVAHKPRNIARQTPVQWAVEPVLFGKRYHEERTKRRLSHEQVRKRLWI